LKITHSSLEHTNHPVLKCKAQTAYLSVVYLYHSFTSSQKTNHLNKNFIKKEMFLLFAKVLPDYFNHQFHL